MKPPKPSLLLFAICIILLAGCGTQTKFASSFGKRRYTKGFYCDVPGSPKQVAINSRGEGLSPIPIKEKTPQVIIKTESEIHNVVTPVAEHYNAVKLNIGNYQKTPQEQLQLQATVQKVPLSMMAITSHHFGGDSSNKGTGVYSIVGFLLVVISILAMFFGLLFLLAGSGSDVTLLLFGALGDLAGIIVCIYALCSHDGQQGFAIAGLGINVLLLVLAHI